MRFGVLGEVQVWDRNGRSAPIPERKVRALLTDLLVHNGEPVSSDRLIDDLWGDDLPANPLGALQLKVSRLRRALEEAEEGGQNLVVSRPAGYVLTADPATVDSTEFATLLSRAKERKDPAVRARLLAEALALWRGPAFADFAKEDSVRPAAHRLEEQRLAAGKATHRHGWNSVRSTSCWAS